jgi:hypothetical protein
MTDHLWILAALAVLAIPFENQFSLGGFGLGRLTILPLFAGVVFLQPRLWLSAWSNSIILAAMIFLSWGAFVEFVHPFSDWELLFRIFQMLVFATLIATVVAVPANFRRILFSLVVVCSIVGFYLVFNFYDLVSPDVLSVKEAATVRAQVADEMTLDENLNILGYTVGMGAITAFARFLVERRGSSRILWGGTFLLCALGVFSTLSRGAFIAVAGALGLMLWRLPTRRFGSQKALFAAGAVAVLLVLTPAALTERFSATGETTVSGKVEGRMQLYTAALESMPQYWSLGVGEGQYWHEWAFNNGFGKITPFGTAVAGPHNGFLAAWIFYGLPGLILLGLVCHCAAMHCPDRSDISWEAIATFGLLVASLIWLLFTHNLYLKIFGVILGLVIAASAKRSTARAHAAAERSPTKRRRLFNPRAQKALAHFYAVRRHRRAW